LSISFLLNILTLTLKPYLSLSRVFATKATVEKIVLELMRPVCSTDAMTASVYEMDFAEFKRLSNLILKIEGVGNLLYDVTTKPPGTIEWE